MNSVLDIPVHQKEMSKMELDIQIWGPRESFFHHKTLGVISNQMVTETVGNNEITR